MLDNNVLWVVHGVYAVRLEDVLPQFQAFLAENKLEVIILDFQHFYKMSEELHHQLVRLLFKYLGQWLCPDDEPCVGTTPMNKLWSKDHRVIVFHGTDWYGRGAAEIVKLHPVVWSRHRLVSPWYNSVDTNELYTSLTAQLGMCVC